MSHQTLSEQELKNLVQEEESEFVERCESPSATEKIAKAICAFSNDMSNTGKAGIIFIGLKDKGQCAGLSVNYPIIALNQLVRNAIIHRQYKSHTPVRIHWFNDRIEIQSPGGPYGELNIDNFGKEGITAYRNPTIAEAFKHLGFVERFGFGIPKAKKALKENGNPELELKAQQSVVLALVKPALPA